jgi:hypothetical protein
MQMSAAISIALRAISSASLSVSISARAAASAIVAARADGHHAMLRLQHVAGAGQRQRDVLVGHQHHRFQPAQIAVGAPVLGEFDAGARQLVGILFELGFQPLEQREGVGGGAGEACNDIALAERRTFRALPFMTVLPRLTWPSPAITTLPPLRTVTMVVPCMMISFDMCYSDRKAAWSRQKHQLPPP